MGAAETSDANLVGNAMNSRNPTGPTGYRTPTPTSHNPTRLLNPGSGMSPAQRDMVRAQFACMSEGVENPKVEDLLEKLNRFETRRWRSEAKQHSRLMAKRAAQKRAKAAKRLQAVQAEFASRLVSL